MPVWKPWQCWSSLFRRSECL